MAKRPFVSVLRPLFLLPVLGLAGVAGLFRRTVRKVDEMGGDLSSDFAAEGVSVAAAFEIRQNHSWAENRNKEAHNAIKTALSLI